MTKELRRSTLRTGASEEMKDASAFRTRYQRVFAACGARTDADMARILEIAPASVAGVKKRESIPMGWIEKVSTMFGVSADWLMYGRGEKIAQRYVVVPPIQAVPTMKAVVPPMKVVAPMLNEKPEAADVDMIFVPLAEAILSAGTGSLETTDGGERKYAFRSDFLHRKGQPKEMVMMRVSGDSMEPEIKHGDVVLLDQSKTRILPGRMYAVGFEDAIYVKKIDTAPGKVILKSENPAYPPIECDMRGDNETLFRVIGQVLWVGREYR